MNYAYTGTAPVQVRDKVIVVDENDNEHDATVRVVLSSQFLAHIPKQGAKFFFYRDKGLTWRVRDASRV